MKKIRALRQPLAAGAVALIAFTLSGQQPRIAPPTIAPPSSPKDTQDQGTAVFKVDINIHTVDVTVKDKSGKIVEGLTAKDFAVTEDGKPVAVQSVDFQKLSINPEPPEPLKLDDQLELPPPPVTEFTKTNPNAAPNAAPSEVTYHDKRLLAFFFDFSSMKVPDQLRAQTGALEFIDKKLSKDDVVAVLLYTSQIQVKTTFTEDRELLTKIIKGLPIGEMSELAGLADTGADDNQDTGAAFVGDETEFNIFNTDQQLAALQDAARMLSVYTEKKELVYFSGGLNKTGVDNQAQLDASVNTLRKANVSIYAMDARGLTADPPGGSASKGSSRGSGNFTGSTVNSQRSTMNDSQETLVTLSKETGGKPFLDSNDIALGIANIQTDVQSYYVLSYKTANTALDGKLRKVNVKLTSGLSASLTYEDGYYGDKSFAKQNSTDREQQLQEALKSGNPVTDLPLAMQVNYFRISPTQYFVPVSIKVPGSAVDLAAKDKSGAKKTTFAFIGQVLDEKKSTAGAVRDNIPINLDQQAATDAPHKSFQYDAGFTLEPGKYRMKFVVQEQITGKMGTFEARLNIPDLSADTSGLKMSSIIWSSQKEALTAAVGAAEKANKKDVVADPRIDNGEKLIPNITRVFRRAQNLYVAFDVYDAKPDPADAKARRVKVTMSFFNEKGAKAFELEPLDETELTTARPETIPVKFQVPLKSLAPGKYICQVNVVDEVGRKFAFPRTPLVILP